MKYADRGVEDSGNWKNGGRIFLRTLIHISGGPVKSDERGGLLRIEFPVSYRKKTYSIISVCTYRNSPLISRTVCLIN